MLETIAVECPKVFIDTTVVPLKHTEIRVHAEVLFTNVASSNPTYQTLKTQILKTLGENAPTGDLRSYAILLLNDILAMPSMNNRLAWITVREVDGGDTFKVTNAKY
jgi:hypothetical protein